MVLTKEPMGNLTLISNTNRLQKAFINYYHLQKKTTKFTSLVATSDALSLYAGPNNLRSFLTVDSTQNYFLIARLFSFL